MKTKWWHAKQLLMNYQTVVDEVTSPLSSPSPRQVSDSPPSLTNDGEQGTKNEKEMKKKRPIIEASIEKVEERRSVKSCRGQITRGEAQELRGKYGACGDG